MPVRVYGENSIEAALRLWQAMRDRLHQIEARIEGNVICDFRLNADTRRQAIDLLQARTDLHLALERLAHAVAQNERQADANAQKPEESLPSEGTDAPRPA